MAKFVPLQHRPQLPYDPFAEHDPVYDPGYYDFVHVAWHVYWQWIETAARRQDCSLVEARQLVHRRGNLPQTSGDKPWSADDCLARFMLQFEGWQQKGYDLAAMHRKDRCRSRYDGFRQMGVSKIAGLDLYLSALSYGEREDLVCFLMTDERWELIEFLVDDPIYGGDARSEIESRKWHEDFELAEQKRCAALPPNVQQIDGILARLGPTNYSVHYPYFHPAHSVPNCLCVLGDGGPIFRLEVLDPDTVTQFRLAELMPPWWSLYSTIGEAPGPGEGEYDFPFPDFGFGEGDVFDLACLLEVIQAGASKISTRGLPDTNHVAAAFRILTLEEYR